MGAHYRGLMSFIFILKFDEIKLPQESCMLEMKRLLSVGEGRILLRLQRLEKDIEDILTKCHKCLTMMEPDQQQWFYL